MKKYKSTILLAFIFMLLIYTRHSIIDLFAGLVTWGDFTNALIELTEPKQFLIALAIISPSILFFSIFCKAVYIKEEEIVVSFILGLKKKAFKRESFDFEHKDKESRFEHLLLWNNHQKTIIYPMGTFKFSKLLLDLKKIRSREPEDREGL